MKPRHLNESTLQLLAKQLSPLLASRDALRDFADQVDQARRNIGTANNRRDQHVDEAVLKLAIEMIRVRTRYNEIKSSTDSKLEREAPASQPPEGAQS